MVRSITRPHSRRSGDCSSRMIEVTAQDLLRTVLAVLVLLGSAHDAHAQSARELTRVWQIGSVDGDAAYVFALVGDIAFGPDGSVYVLDAGNAVVRVYDASGRHVRSFGRSGEGPGEFRFPTRLALADDELTIFDAPLRRATVFDHTGQLLETRTLTANEGGFDIILPLRHGGSASDVRVLLHGEAVSAISGDSEAGAVFRP